MATVYALTENRRRDDHSFVFRVQIDMSQSELREYDFTRYVTRGETAIYTALALLIGAFIACVSAAIGGRLRDEHP